MVSKDTTRRGAPRLTLVCALLFTAGSGLQALTPGVAAAAGEKTKKVDLNKPFDHDSHLALLRKKADRKMNCDDCHVIPKKEGEGKQAFPICESTRMPFPAHKTCTGCHPKAFFTKPLQICSNCHTDNTFQAKPPLKAQTTRAAPRRTVFSHKLHMNPKQRVNRRFEMKKDCSFCHTFAKDGSPTLPGHAQCCDCHTKDGVEPGINDCAGCHQRPEKDPHPRSKIQHFSHDDHGTDPRSGATLECTVCHTEMAKTAKLKDIVFPKMATCVDCHAGEVAFDYAECLRCHGEAEAKAPLPPGHPKPKAKPAK